MIKRLLTNNGILIIQSAVSSLVPIYLLPHIITNIGLGTYGRLAVALAWANYAVFVVQYAFQSTGPRQLAQLRENETPRLIFTEICKSKFLLFILTLSATISIELFTSLKVLSTPQLILLCLLPLGAALNSAWYLQTMGKFLAICVVSIIGSAAAVILGLVLVRSNSPSSIIGATVALSIGPVFFGAATFLVAFKSLRVEKRALRSASIRHQISDGWPLFLSQAAASLYGLSGPIVISLLVNSESAGAYSMLERIVNPLMAVCMLTHTAAYPELARLYVSNRSAYFKLLKFVVIAYLCCAAAITSLSLLYKDWMQQHFFGSSGLHGLENLIAWGLAWFFLGIFGTALTGYLVVSGRQREIWPLTLRILLLTLVLGLPGTYYLGAWAWMAALVLSQTQVLLTGYQLWREEKRNT